MFLLKKKIKIDQVVGACKSGGDAKMWQNDKEINILLIG